MKVIRRIILFSTTILLEACAGQVGAPLTPITLQLQWTHQAEFAGFYAADQHSYYAEEGLIVTFLPGGPEVDNCVGVSPDQYTVVNLPSDVELFSSGEVPIWGGYVNGMVVSVQQAGRQINLIYPDDYGVHFYGDTIITTDDLIASDPDLALRFLRATLKGWTYAVENLAEAPAMVQKYLPEADVSVENARMNASLPLVYTGEDLIGWMKPGIWLEMEATMRDQGVLEKKLDISQVYTMQFLEQIYGDRSAP